MTGPSPAIRAIAQVSQYSWRVSASHPIVQQSWRRISHHHHVLENASGDRERRLDELWVEVHDSLHRFAPATGLIRPLCDPTGHWLRRRVDKWFRLIPGIQPGILRRIEPPICPSRRRLGFPRRSHAGPSVVRSRSFPPEFGPAPRRMGIKPLKEFTTLRVPGP